MLMMSPSIAPPINSSRFRYRRRPFAAWVKRWTSPFNKSSVSTTNNANHVSQCTSNTVNATNTTANAITNTVNATSFTPPISQYTSELPHALVNSPFTTTSGSANADTTSTSASHLTNSVTFNHISTSLSLPSSSAPALTLAPTLASFSPLQQQQPLPLPPPPPPPPPLPPLLPPPSYPHSPHLYQHHQLSSQPQPQLQPQHTRQLPNQVSQSRGFSVALDPILIRPSSSPSLASLTSTSPQSLSDTLSFREPTSSTFTSSDRSQHSLSTAFTTLHSISQQNTLEVPPNTLHNHSLPHSSTINSPSNSLFTTYNQSSPLTPLTSHATTYTGLTANNLLSDDASILTLASSSKRCPRRNSLDTNASVRALPPSSLFGNSRESLPLSHFSPTPATSAPPSSTPSTATSHHVSLH